MILMGCVCHIAYITAEKAIGTFVKSVEFDIDYYPPSQRKEAAFWALWILQPVSQCLLVRLGNMH